MAILGKFYDENTHTDKVWYDSSNVVFSKFVENENDNNGQLYITFKNGATYHYKDVDMPTDYLLFKNGGIDNSQGKTLNKQIKGKYEYERIGDENITILMEELEKVNKTKLEEPTQEITPEVEKTAIINALDIFIEAFEIELMKGNVNLGDAQVPYEELKILLDNRTF